MVALLVGLGNPGNSYRNTRHNIGFEVLDALALNLKLQFSAHAKFHSQIAQYKTSLSTFYLIKPLSFMNLSGESVRRVLTFYHSDCMLVVHDDLDLPLGALRFKKGGSSGGHNGLKSIDLHCYQDYYRLRLGIGRGVQIPASDYVLGKFTQEEMEKKETLLKRSVEALLNFMECEDFERVKNHFSYNPLKMEKHQIKES